MHLALCVTDQMDQFRPNEPLTDQIRKHQLQDDQSVLT